MTYEEYKKQKKEGTLSVSSGEIITYEQFKQMRGDTYAPLDTSKVTDWVNRYQGVMSELRSIGDYTAGLGSDYRSQIDSLIKEYYGLQGVGRNTYSNFDLYANELLKLRGQYDYTAQFKNEAEMKQYEAAQKRQEGQLTFDTQKGKADIETMEADFQTFLQVNDWYKTYINNGGDPDADFIQNDARMQDYRRLTGLYGDINSLKAKLDQSKLYQSQAETLQLLESPGGYNKERDWNAGEEGWSAYSAQKAADMQAEQGKPWWQKFLEFNAQNFSYADPSTSVLGQSWQNARRVYAEDDSYKEPSDQWTDEQKNKFGFLYQSDPAKAQEYAIAVNEAINSGKRNEQMAAISEKAGNTFLGGAGQTLASIATNIAFGLPEFADNLAEFSARGTVTQKGGATPMDWASATQSGIAGKLNDKYGTIDENAFILGGKGLGDLYTVGTSAAQSLAGAYLTGGGPGMLISFMGIGGANAVDDALSRGATGEQAILYGIIRGSAEGAAEMIPANKLLKLDAKGWQKFLTGVLNQALGESIEEGVTSVVEKFADGMIMQDNSNYNRAVQGYVDSGMSLEEAQKKAMLDMVGEVAYDAIGGFISGGMNAAIVGGGQNVASENSLTENEEAVVKKEIENRIAEAEKDGKVSLRDEKRIRQEVLRDMARGQISIDIIEEVLGGETYASYTDTVKQEDALQAEFDALNKMKQGEMTGEQIDRRAELKEQLQNIKANSKRGQIKTQLYDEVFNLAKDSRLMESYRERDRRGQAFTADVKKYTDPYARKTIQNIIDSGIANDTNITHDFADMLAKLSKDKKISFDFTNNAKLKDSVFGINGKSVNGYITKDGVTVNLNSAKALNSVVGHEITHVLEGTEFYDQLQSVLFEYAKSKGEFDTRLNAIIELYKGVEGANAKQELTADLVGDYLFTDKGFIDRLSMENRGVFQKIFDEIKYLCRIATAGSKEARRLEKVKKLFEDAYRQETKNPTAEGGVRYSIERTKGMSWSEQINGALYGGKNIRRNDTLVVGNSADTSVATEVADKPLAIPLRVLTKARSGKDISHSIKNGKLAKLDAGIKNAPITIVNPERNAIVYITNIKQGGLPIVAAFEMNSNFDGDEVHKATSIHLQVDTMSMLENLPGSATVYAQKNELDSVGATNNLRGLAAKIKFIDSTISQDSANVKEQFSLSKQEPADTEYGNYNVYGGDVALDIGPVAERAQSGQREIAPYADSWKESFDALTDEDAPPDPADKNPAPGTRKALHQSIIDGIKADFSGRGYDFDEVLKNAKDLSTFATVDNTPQRVLEKALGYKEGQALADMTVNKVAQNETEGIRWLNSFTDKKNGLLAKISKQYGIKPGSKASAAAQMYAEGFYVGENNAIVAYGDRELAADFPNATVRENIKKLAGDPRIRQIYDETLAAINESRARNAYPEIPRLGNYFLHFRAMDDTFSRLGLPFNPNDIRAKDLPTDLNGVTADLKPGQPYFASAMHRKGKRTSFDLLGGLEKYLTSAKNQIYHIDDIQTLRALRNYVAETYGQASGLENLDLLSDEEAEQRIKDVYNAHLSTFAKFLNEEANVLAGKTALIDRGLEGVIGRRGITFLNTLNRQVGANMVGFNVSSSLTNFLAPAQAFAKTNKFDFVKAMAQTAANKIGTIFGNGDSFAEESPVMIRRKGAERFYRTPYEKAADAGYVLMSAVDNISTELIARTKYNELTRKGMGAQQAHIETDKWVSRLMGDRSLGQQPQLYNSKMLGLITKFQLEVRNQLDSQFYDTIQEAKVSTEDIENKLLRNAKKAVKITSTFVQLAAVQHLFGKAFESVAGYNPAFDIVDALIKAFGWDDEEDNEDTVLDNIEEGFLTLLGDLPYTSTLTGGRIPIASALPITEFINGEDQYGNEKSRWETLGEAAPYYLLPGGYGQIKKTAEGMGMFRDEHPIAGSYTDSGNLRFPVEDTLGNRVQAGFFGQYASENARDYFDNERSPLNEAQIEEFLATGMQIRDYWDYRGGLIEHDTLDEKVGYIAGLDLPVNTKNVLVNNMADRKEPIDITVYDKYGDLEEMDFAIKNPEKYEVAVVVGGYESYMKYREDMKDMDLAEKADYISGLNLSVAQKNALINGETDRKEPIDLTGYENYSGFEEFEYAKKNPESYALAKSVGGYESFVRYAESLGAIKADKNKWGESISGSRKPKVYAYIYGLDIPEIEKHILFKSEYPSTDDYNYEILEYVNANRDLTYDEKIYVLQKLGFKVSADGYVRW